MTKPYSEDLRIRTVEAVANGMSRRQAAKVFKVGLLMHGKAPDMATLMRWARQA